MEKSINNKVKIHEITRITPFFSSTAEFSFPLTLFDTYWFKFHPIERLFFCLSHVALRCRKTSHLLLPKDGVSVTVAESNTDFNYLCGNAIHEAVEFLPLTPLTSQLSTSDDKAAVIAIQITMFPNEGFCIGISTHHIIFDGRSSVMFMKDPTGIDMVFINNWLAFTVSDTNPNKRSLKSLPSFVDLDNLVQATFVLTCEDIKELRDNILSVLDKVNGNEVKKFDKLHLSTFVLTGAYVYSCMVKAKGAENNRDVLFGFTADYRKCLDLPIPMNYFGNCVGTRAMVAKTRDFMEETGVLFVAEKLSDMIKELEDGLTLEGFEEKLVKLMPMMKSVAQGAQGLGVIGSNRFDAYKSDFG
ncbi:hypothetical protein CISIN_1g044220mg, partial [Citrus sinensis]